MYRTGHLGVSLLVFAPVGYALVAAGYPGLAVLTGATMVWLTMLPDVDHRLPLVPHRGPTHSLLFAALVGGVFGGAGHLLAGQAGGSPALPLGVPLAVFGFVVGFVAVLAHLLGDVLTPAGVNFLWPVSSRRYSLSVARASDTVANYLLFALGVFAVAAAAYLALVAGAGG